MAGRDSEVGGTRLSVPRKDAVTMEEVIRDTADEEQGGKGGRREHESFVSCDFAATNAQVACQKADRAHKIERGIHRWQKGYPFGCASTALEVNQPDQKRYCTQAQSADREQYTSGGRSVRLGSRG